ncbi:hypothetical protein DPMN_193979 [Dreissena polymorpha]|uniref:Uncharacterized protein n=1 Tax=Dreissena polymorpha TaxID=45954 RepID=A0A9D3Y1X8_DREPO|nr:hypothetical protein DPMN_193979 [Dreissena polymorpha]
MRQRHAYTRINKDQHGITPTMPDIHDNDTEKRSKLCFSQKSIAQFFSCYKSN